VDPESIQAMANHFGEKAFKKAKGVFRNVWLAGNVGNSEMASCSTPKLDSSGTGGYNTGGAHRYHRGQDQRLSLCGKDVAAGGIWLLFAHWSHDFHS
jgi:hypothetical protein